MKSSSEEKSADALLDHRFKESLLGLSSLLTGIGVSNWLSRGEGGELLIFPQLSLEDKMRCLDDLELFVASCFEVVAGGSTVDDSPALAWQMLRKMGYGPQFDFFDKIGEGDVLQAYDLANRQVFRNVEFFKYSSHSLEDLFTLSWTSLSTRDEKFEQQLLALSMDLITKNLDHSIDPEVPEHEYEELCSRDRLRGRIKLKSIVPLHRNGKVAALLVISRVELLKRM